MRPYPSSVFTGVRLAAATVVAAGLLAGCAGPRTAPAPTPLDGTAWMLTELNAQSPAPDAAAPTLRFDGDRVSGGDGCNRFVGPIVLRGDSLRIGRDLATSRRSCTDTVLAGAEAYSRALARTVSYRRDGGSLVLLDARGAALATFVPQPSGLTGKVWRVMGYGDGARSAVGVRPGSLVTVEFDPEGRVRGFGGCAPYAGTWSLVERRLAIGPLQTVRGGGCDRPDLQTQEEAVLQSLSRAAAMRQDGERLELRDTSGALVATATALPRTAPVSQR